MPVVLLKPVKGHLLQVPGLREGGYSYYFYFVENPVIKYSFIYMDWGGDPHICDWPGSHLTYFRPWSYLL
jgi:hypothetical protein